LQYKPFPLKVGNKTNKMAYIGVYGTLKRGQRANGMLANSPLVGTFRVSIPFQMFNLGSFPALIASEEEHGITFEVYHVNDDAILLQLDRYEGYPSLYQKSTIQIESSTEHGVMDVTIYTMKERETRFYTPMESGNWE